MSISRWNRLLSGALLALLATVPPTRHLLEQQMLTHMLVQIPALLLAGGLIGTSVSHASPASRWNVAGVPALLAASLILAFWMLPIAIDHAVASARWDAVKALSIVCAGALAATSWQVAPTVVQAFFGGNLAWMSIAVGQFYQDEGPRLCNAYLQDDQSVTGNALTWLAIGASVLWVANLASSDMRLRREIRPSPGDSANET